jgi:prolyl-tRNA synthetase
MHKSHRIKDVAENLYKTLSEANIEALFDDRKERPGVMFNDMELIGIPHTFIIGERNLDDNNIEYKNRATGEKQLINIDDINQFIKEFI